MKNVSTESPIRQDILRRIASYTNPLTISPVDTATARRLVARDLTLERVRRDLKNTTEITMIDPLSKLFNRRYLDGDANQIGELERLYERAKRERRPLGAIMLDIDHFKIVNDQHGHIAGDEILRKIADLIRMNIRKTDVAVRYGGEEILLLLPDVTPNGVRQIAEILRQAVEKYNFNINGLKNGLNNVTISLGATSFDPNNSTLFENKNTLIEVVDKAMYLSKQKGRNKTTVAQEKKLNDNGEKQIWRFI